MEGSGFWMVVWIALAAALGAGEIMAAGSFFLLPFAVGALAAFGGAALGIDLALQLVLFIAGSAGSFLALRPLARRMEANHTAIAGVGADRLIGSEGRILEPIGEPGEGPGLVVIDRQQWRAESLEGTPVPAGARVRVVEVRGTRVVVFPVDLPAADDPGHDGGPG